MTSAPTTLHPAFEWLRSQEIDALNITVEEYRHKKTGAVHFHINADNDENVFLVALRTVPMNSTGVAHILEHTALCGSEKYPVRDPFFMMIRRSLNTFMNAFTSSDWTAYPFASQNRKDFDNLIDVYLDAVFFSRLDELDFCQEGHRLEFAELENPDSELQYKGVVFNEMKGAMSSVPSTLWHTLCKYLYPSTTYHYNSGGDPEYIPDLSYEQLKQFYRSHYHPTNAIFMTFGNIPAVEHQHQFENKALSRFERLDVHIQVPREKRYHAPLRVQESYAFDDDAGTEHKTHIVMGWLSGLSADLEALLKAQLLASVLLDNSASPLQRALETTDLGTAPSPLCGLEDSMRELTFVCGIEGSDIDKVEAFEKLVLNVFRDVAENGVPYEQVAAVLHQLELHQREIGGDGHPYGLQLILNALGSATHRGDPIALLDLEPVLAKLHESIKDPAFIKQQARELLDNPHRVTLIMTPDTAMAKRREEAETAQLAVLKQQLDENDKAMIIARAKSLQERQNRRDDESILPKVGLEDVPADIRVIDGKTVMLGNTPCHTYTAGTNGLVYQQILIELPPLTDAQIDLLPYYTSMLTEVGIGGADYLSTQQQQSAVCGGINAYTSMRGAVEDEQQARLFLVLSSKALVRNQQQQSRLMYDTLNAVRFDELPRLRELLSQQRSRREQSITGNGHGLAMAAASAGMSPTALLNHRLGGLDSIVKIKKIDSVLNDPNELQRYADDLQTLHSKMLTGARQLLLITETEQLATCQSSLNELWQNSSVSGSELLQLPHIRESRREFWVANSQVNFCAKAYPTVPINHSDSAPLIVLGGFLRNGFLHRAIREQGGAYGGGASQDSNTASFRFYSYRDPRLVDTLTDFDQAIDWLLSSEHDGEQLEQAILGVISSLDKPGSPAGEAKQAFHNELFGRDPAQRRQLRQRLLSVTIDDLQRVAKTYLQPEVASIGIVSSQGQADKLKEWIASENIQLCKL